jgi:hypothetical protein
MGIPIAQYRTCNASPAPGLPPNGFDSLDCCSVCANTLNCYQAYTDSASNTCTLDIRIGSNGDNTNLTPDCPNFHTWVIFGESRGGQGGGNYPSGFLAGHCSQAC